jgi:hypothetical protein
VTTKTEPVEPAEAVAPVRKGRRPLSPTGESMTAAERQQRVRRIAMEQLSNGRQKDISTSGLISLLPRLISDKMPTLVTKVCKEIIHREGSSQAVKGE